MKRTVNVDKVESVEVDLLEEAAKVILAEIRKRANAVVDASLDRNSPETVEIYTKRREGFHAALEAVEGLPERVKWME